MKQFQDRIQDRMREFLDAGDRGKALLLVYREVFHPLTSITVVLLWAAYYHLLPWGFWTNMLVSGMAASTASPLFRAYMVAVWEAAKCEGVDVPALLAGLVERVRSERVPGVAAAFALLVFVYWRW